MREELGKGWKVSGGEGREGVGGVGEVFCEGTKICLLTIKFSQNK